MTAPVKDVAQALATGQEVIGKPRQPPLITDERDGSGSAIAMAISGDIKDSDEVRRALIETLYSSPLSLALGALGGTAISSTIAAHSGDPLVAVFSLLIFLVAVERTWAMLMFNRRRKAQATGNHRWWERAYEAGAWVFAALLGLLALTVLVRVPAATDHVLAVALASGYSGGIAARNAGRLHIAIGQVLLTLTPMTVGLWIADRPGYLVLAFVSLLMMMGMSEISATTHRILVGALRDKRDKGLLAEKFEAMAKRDNLTGIDNRMSLQARLAELAALPDAASRTIGFLWLDLDRFKEINDSLGHMVGDKMLCQVALRLQETVGERGMIARFGGDEFVVVCTDSDWEETFALGERVLAAINTPFRVDVHCLDLSGSIGVAVGALDPANPDENLLNADIALYEAKRNGRRRVERFTPELKSSFNRTRDLETNLRQAIAENALSIHYQPIVEAATGRITCCEALCRWTDPKLGVVPPSEFIPLAETTGLIGPLSEVVLRKAATDATQWPSDIRLAVNLSPGLISSAHFAGVLVGTLIETGLNPHRLELELTESLFLENRGQIDQILRDLRRIGVQLSLDDFGTGYSSLGYLRQYRFETLKIDQSFIREARKSHEDQAVIAAMAFLARELNMGTVAEGIETEDHYQFAVDSGFTHVQGFLLCRPQPQEAILPILRKGISLEFRPRMPEAIQRTS